LVSFQGEKHKFTGFATTYLHLEEQLRQLLRIEHSIQIKYFDEDFAEELVLYDLKQLPAKARITVELLNPSEVCFYSVPLSFVISRKMSEYCRKAF
jgi:hypothetical protein